MTHPATAMLAAYVAAYAQRVLEEGEHASQAFAQRLADAEALCTLQGGDPEHAWLIGLSVCRPGLTLDDAARLGVDGPDHPYLCDVRPRVEAAYTRDLLAIARFEAEMMEAA
jgi:hypothetical protein